MNSCSEKGFRSLVPATGRAEGVQREPKQIGRGQVSLQPIWTSSHHAESRQPNSMHIISTIAPRQQLSGPQSRIPFHASSFPSLSIPSAEHTESEASRSGKDRRGSPSAPSNCQSRKSLPTAPQPRLQPFPELGDPPPDEAVHFHAELLSFLGRSF